MGEPQRKTGATSKKSGIQEGGEHKIRQGVERQKDRREIERDRSVLQGLGRWARAKNDLEVPGEALHRSEEAESDRNHEEGEGLCRLRDGRGCCCCDCCVERHRARWQDARIGHLGETREEGESQKRRVGKINRGIIACAVRIFLTGCYPALSRWQVHQYCEGFLMEEIGICVQDGLSFVGCFFSMYSC